MPIRYLGATVQHGVQVDAVSEMVSVLDAQRAYEANASVFAPIRQVFIGCVGSSPRHSRRRL